MGEGCTSKGVMIIQHVSMALIVIVLIHVLCLRVAIAYQLAGFIRPDDDVIQVMRNSRIQRGRSNTTVEHVKQM